MNRPKLLINLPPGFFCHNSLRPSLARLESLACEVRKTSHNTPAEMADDAAWAEAIVMWGWPDLTDTILTACPGLKFIGHINGSRKMAEAELRHGITVSEARHGWSPAVAEMALTLMLTVLRKAGDHHARMRAGTEGWVQDFPGDIDVSERRLGGRRVGIVGFGRIGQLLAELLRPFGGDLRAYDPYLPTEVAARFGARLAGLDELVADSEVIVLCAANTEESRHLITRRHIEAMRPGTVLVNVGRSSLIDMAALLERLRRGDIAAALDVFDHEPLEADSPLRTLPNAYLTPHRAGGILESVQDILAMLTDDLARHLAGQPLKFPLTEKDLHCLA
jgi:phosphoglycerate dehydrogenase-like enzyme